MSDDKIKVPYLSRRITGKERVRVAAFILWPESCNIDLVDRMIEETRTPCARSPLHDKDTYTRNDVEAWLDRHGAKVDLEWSESELRECVDRLNAVLDASLCCPWIGDRKKPHYHYVIAFSGSKTSAQICEMIGNATDYIERVDNKAGALKYLCHLKNPEKYQYSIEEIKNINGMDLSCITTIDELERMDYSDQIIDYIEKNRVWSFWSLMNWARKSGDFQLKKEIKASAPFWMALISSFGNERAAARREYLETEKAIAERAEDLGISYDAATGEVVEGDFA